VLAKTESGRRLPREGDELIRYVLKYEISGEEKKESKKTKRGQAAGRGYWSGRSNRTGVELGIAFYSRGVCHDGGNGEGKDQSQRPPNAVGHRRLKKRFLPYPNCYSLNDGSVWGEGGGKKNHDRVR